MLSLQHGRTQRFLLTKRESAPVQGPQYPRGKCTRVSTRRKASGSNAALLSSVGTFTRARALRRRSRRRKLTSCYATGQSQYTPKGVRQQCRTAQFSWHVHACPPGRITPTNMEKTSVHLTSSIILLGNQSRSNKYGKDHSTRTKNAYRGAYRHAFTTPVTSGCV